MRTIFHVERLELRGLAMMLGWLLVVGALRAQTAAATPASGAAQAGTPQTTAVVPTTADALQTSKKEGVITTTQEMAKAPDGTMPKAPGTEIDRVVAIVNGDLILDSDVDQERRFAALLPYGEASGAYDRDQAVERLINRELILQQAKLQPGDEVTDEAAEKDLDSLRKELPTCKEYHCETKAGWDSFLAKKGFTEQSLLALWKQRMEVLGFIEERFRMGITVSPTEIQTYYDKTMLPLYAQQHVPPPPLKSVSDRIQEVLLQQRVSSLLDNWLESLKAQGSVVVLHPGDEAP